MPFVVVREILSPAFTKNFVGSRPESATWSNASNFFADIRILIWNFAARRSSPGPDGGTKTSDPTPLPLPCPASGLHSRTRRTPVSSSSPPPVASLTLSPFAATTFMTSTLSLPSSMTSRALVGLKLTSGMSEAVVLTLRCRIACATGRVSAWHVADYMRVRRCLVRGSHGSTRLHGVLHAIPYTTRDLVIYKSQSKNLTADPKRVAKGQYRRYREAACFDAHQ